MKKNTHNGQIVLQKQTIKNLNMQKLQGGISITAPIVVSVAGTISAAFGCTTTCIYCTASGLFC